jgi:hypothetical protein
MFITSFVPEQCYAYFKLFDNPFLQEFTHVYINNKSLCEITKEEGFVCTIKIFPPMASKPKSSGGWWEGWQRYTPILQPSVEQG